MSTYYLFSYYLLFLGSAGMGGMPREWVSCVSTAALLALLFVVCPFFFVGTQTCVLYLQLTPPQKGKRRRSNHVTPNGAIISTSVSKLILNYIFYIFSSSSIHTMSFFFVVLVFIVPTSSHTLSNQGTDKQNYPRNMLPSTFIRK